MIKNIIREVSDPDFEFYFDTDCFSSAAGDFGYTLFIVTDDRYGYSHDYKSYINKEDFEEVKKNCRYFFDEVDDFMNGYNDYYKNIKSIMKDYNLPYSPKAAHNIKMWVNVYDDFENPKLISHYLELKTGKEWKIYHSYGCCQGDYAEIIFCPEFYKEDELNVISDLVWGMGKEFCILFDGDEDNAVYGYFIADCEYRNDNDIKTYFCKMEGFNEDETVLEVISGSHTYTKYDYETV